MSDSIVSSEFVASSLGTATIGPLDISGFRRGSFTCPAVLTAAAVTFKATNRPSIHNIKTNLADFAVINDEAASLTPIAAPVLAVGKNVNIPGIVFNYSWIILEFAGIEPDANKFRFCLKS